MSETHERKHKLGSVRQRPGRPGWYVRFTHNGRRREVYGGDTEDDALFLLMQLRHGMKQEVLEGRRTIARVTVKQMLDEVKELIEAENPGGPDRVIGELEIVAAHFGTRPMCEITTADLRDFLVRRRHRGKALKPATKRRSRAVMSKLWQHAIERGAAENNPTEGLSLPTPDEKPIPYLSPADVARFYAATPGRLRPFVVVIGETGLRRSLVRSLRWCDVSGNLDRIITPATKNHESRDIPLTPLAGRTIESLFAARPDDAPVDRSDPIFPDLPCREWVSELVRRTAKAAGFSNLRLHGLRHAFCSGLAQAGVPLPTIALLSGHKSLSMVMRYAKHAPSDARITAMDQLARARGQIPAEPPPTKPDAVGEGSAGYVPRAS